MRGSFDFANVGFDGRGHRLRRLRRPRDVGHGARSVFTDGNIAGLSETDSTIYQAASDTSVTGSRRHDRLRKAPRPTLRCSSGTVGKADRDQRLGRRIGLDAAQAEVVGGSDRFAFSETTGNRSVCSATAGHCRHGHRRRWHRLPRRRADQRDRRRRYDPFRKRLRSATEVSLLSRTLRARSGGGDTVEFGASGTGQPL